MTITLPRELGKDLKKKAKEQSTTPEALAEIAIRWYLMGPELRDELDAYQEMRDEALRIVEERDR